MKTYALMLQKGGVGKSTIAGNVAYALAERSRVALVDADVQGNLTSWFLTGSVQSELSDVLSGKNEIKKALVDVTDNLKLLPTLTGSSDLATYKETALFREPFVFEDLNAVFADEGFEYVIYDTAPGLNQMERSVALAVDEVVPVMRPEYFSLDGLETFYSFLTDVNRSYRRDVGAPRLVLNMVNDAYTAHKRNKARAETYDAELFIVPQDVNVEKAQEHHLPLVAYNPRARAGASIEQIAEALRNGNN